MTSYNVLLIERVVGLTFFVSVEYVHSMILNQSNMKMVIMI